MTGRAALVYSFAEQFPALSAHLDQAWLTGRSAGSGVVTPAVGNAIRCFAAAMGAQHIVDIGGADLCGIWALDGAPSTAVVTTIVLDPSVTEMVHDAYAAAGIAPQRRRFLTGSPMEALSKLTDGSYDLVVIACPPTDLPTYVDQALRLLRGAGAMMVMDMLASGRAAEPTCRDADAVLMREVLRHLRDDPRLSPMLLPLGTGMLIAVREQNENDPNQE